jgi:hypothetical protein
MKKPKLSLFVALALFTVSAAYADDIKFTNSFKGDPPFGVPDGASVGGIGYGAHFTFPQFREPRNFIKTKKARTWTHETPVLQSYGVDVIELIGGNSPRNDDWYPLPDPEVSVKPVLESYGINVNQLIGRTSPSIDGLWYFTAPPVRQLRGVDVKELIWRTSPSKDGWGVICDPEVNF